MAKTIDESQTKWSSPIRIPPNPSLMGQLFARYKELTASKRLPPDMTFEQFFAYWASKRRGENLPGIDDGVVVGNMPAGAPQLIDRPPAELKGVVRTLVLLVDFPDCPASNLRNEAFYQRMLFGDDENFPTGSMSQFYRCASNYDEENQRGIDVQGEVFGWFRMPQAMSYYANGGCGTLPTSPRNSQGLTVDAVAAALEAGVDFSGYDVFGEGAVTALFIVHAGPGAENSGNANHIWSHKWVLPEDINVSADPHIAVRTYLTVNEDCNMGVCAHEWGHLVARWADFYDTGEHHVSNGLGHYCVMATGSWGDGGLTPTLPCGMLRMFHNWVDVEHITESRSDIELKGAAEGGGVVVIQNEQTMTDDQYILVEYRRRVCQDRMLPDEGIAVYVVDEAIDHVNDEERLAIELIQADDKRHLAKTRFGNRGDAFDLFPLDGKRTISKTTRPPLNLPNGQWSGVKIRVAGSAGGPTMRISVEVDE